MKVNTDGVLLGAWMGITGAERAMLDVGTGSGVIALMAAQRVSTIRKASDVRNKQRIFYPFLQHL